MADWTPLRAELAQWRAAQLSLPLWWRDDDAVTLTPALDHLSQMASDLTLPVHLAVIPAGAQQALADHVARTPLLVPTVHGWAHHNTAPPGQKKAEFGHLRPGIAGELAQGLTRLRDLFGSSLVPAFVAPWNRLHPEVLPLLVQTGYRIVSTFAPRPSPCPAPGLRAINTHIDPIDWRGTRGLIDPDRIIFQTVAVLSARRHGTADTREPFGYLTHHLVHTPDVWRFSNRFLRELLYGGAQSVTLTQSLKETE